MAFGTNVCHQCTLQMEAKQAFGQQKTKLLLFLSLAV
jgi:hypothetical protein